MAKPTEQHEVISGSIEELRLILARMDAAWREQVHPTPDKAASVREDKYETAVVLGFEPGIDDGRGSGQRPEVVRADDKGWRDVEWTW